MVVFVSHIHEEEKIAKVLKDWIESTFAGKIKVFVSSDSRDIRGGDKWFSKIDTALHSSSMFLVLCSPSSLSRPWINFETGCAWIKEVKVIPLCHSNANCETLPQPLSQFQGFNLESEMFVDDLLSCLQEQAKIPQLPRIKKDVMQKELDDAIKSVKMKSQSIQKTKAKRRNKISEVDALNAIESWMGSRDARLNTNVIKYSDVDDALNLPKGTAKKLIENAASRWSYVVRRRGDDTILFEHLPRAHKAIRRNRWPIIDWDTY